MYIHILVNSGLTIVQKKYRDLDIGPPKDG